jgi:tRNA threonylcarbamoyladenosine biosynthesis protein TsaB
VRVLSIESSGRIGSIALIDASGVTPEVLLEVPTAERERTAQSLVPAIQAALEQLSWRPADVGLVCVTTGPGSFTGLRIGVVAAKTFAYAVGAKLVGVHTLQAMAFAARPARPRLWTVLDAQRQELFAACFHEGHVAGDDAADATEILSVNQLSEQLRPGDAIIGPPLAKLREELPPTVEVLDQSLWRPTAGPVGALGIQRLAAGQGVSPLQLVPCYYRKSAAEEKAQRPIQSA